MNNPQFPTARKSGLVVQEVPDEILVYDLDSNKAHCLNQTAAIVWKSCDGKNSVSDIAKLVETEAGSKVSEDFVWLAIDQLSENNLLESEIRSAFSGESRREVIKKIGLASMVGLPIIASLVAPQSAMASASCACVTTPECIAKTCPTTICSLGVCGTTA
ncbi:MAG: PqqD family protein [Acidobacteriota bacterium]